MQIPPEIAFHNVDKQDWAEAEIRDHIADLERIFDRLITCRVRVEQRANNSNGTIPPVVHIELSMPELRMPQVSIPQVSMPQVSIPKVSEAQLARLRELGVGSAADERADAGAIHASTAAMISRWRNSVGLRPISSVEHEDSKPSMTLLDIVESEHDLEGADEPLSAVIDILRGAKRPVESE